MISIDQIACSCMTALRAWAPTWRGEAVPKRPMRATMGPSSMTPSTTSAVSQNWGASSELRHTAQGMSVTVRTTWTISLSSTALEPVFAQYEEVIKWQFHLSFDGETNVGVIEPGGWYRDQDSRLCFRFVSELTRIGRDDFDNVTMEFEVNNE